MTYAIKAKSWGITKIRDAHGIKTDAAFAESLGISAKTLARARQGYPVSGLFLAGMKEVYHVDLSSDIYEIETLAEDAAA